MPDEATRRHADDLRAASKLAVDATRAITRIVREMHRTIASGPAVLGRPLARPVDLVTGLVYGHVERVTDLVGTGIDAALSHLSPFLGASTPGPEREAVLAALNGVLGDHLLASGSPLAIKMAFRQDGRSLPLEPEALRAALPDARRKLLVLVHGSSMTDRQWLRGGHDHGAALAKELGLTPVYLVYNSGLHISTNGRAFAELLEQLVRAWPTEVDEISVLGHSMGGLVARSACRVAEVEGLSWRSKLRRLVCLGSPHHGSPLERGGSWIDALLDVSAYSAPLVKLGKIRSAGVTDMRYGNVTDEDWHGRERFELARDARKDLSLPEGVACFAIAATRAPTVPEGTSPARLPGDGLVPVESALGLHRRRDLSLRFPEENRWIAAGTSHLDLLASKAVYEKLRSWFARDLLAPATG